MNEVEIMRDMLTHLYGEEASVPPQDDSRVVIVVIRGQMIHLWGSGTSLRGASLFTPPDFKCKAVWMRPGSRDVLTLGPSLIETLNLERPSEQPDPVDPEDMEDWHAQHEILT